jgi:BASS family bile acid:Na+ symporter
MKDVLIETLKVIAPLSVASIVLAQGLRIAPSLVLDLFRERLWLLLRILIAVLVLVPAAALAILLGFHAAQALAVGLAILVACPPAPLMVSSAPNKGASAPFMAKLHLLLSALAFVTVPAVVYVLSGALGVKARVDRGAMVWTLARTNLGPLALGLAVRGFAPAVADRVGPILDKAGKIGIAVVVLFALATFYPALLNMDPWSYLIIGLVSIAALAIGHAAGPEDPNERTALAVECGVRHPALAIAIATANFGAERTLPVLFPCVIAFMAIAMLYLALRQRTLGAVRPNIRDTLAVTSGKPR